MRATFDDTPKGGPDYTLGTYYSNSLRAQALSTLITSLFQNIWVSNWNWGLFKIEEAILSFLAQNI